ncbi:MAG TPA: DNA-directed RNA polymerase subunit omega [bacterium]|nr:DNA-directed RNA polymerase subunit omega [bacterium]
MTDEKKTPGSESGENRYMSVLAVSKRARQLLDRAEKHNLTVDTEKVILQSLNEFVVGKVTYTNSPVPPKKKKKDEE